MADVKDLLDVNKDGKTDLKDLQAAAEKAGIKDVNDVKEVMKKAGIDSVDDVKDIAKKASGLLGKKEE